MYLNPIEALSPIDGRYAAAVGDLRATLSEGALIRERIRIEAAWLLHLESEVPQLPAARLPNAVRARAVSLRDDPGADAPAAVKNIEKLINHDVKAVEYFVRDALAAAGAAPATLELVHFACTSEDINNIAYARMLKGARELMLHSLGELRGALAQFAVRYADLAMLGRTHGQPASPTTLGKEFANVVARLKRAEARWAHVEILGKWNGAVGNFNAHAFAVPQVDWPAVARKFVDSLGLAWNAHTTQIEPHDWIGEYCDALAATNVILLDFARDTWAYISIGYLKQRTLEAEVGSSTMPHKVNPIDFENAEGNLGVANAMLRHFSEKLPISRWQRDLTDSTVLRNVGVALAHTVLAWRALARGLGKTEPDGAKIAVDLGNSWEVLAEAVQTLLRSRGVPGGYETLKNFSRGRTIDAAALRELIESLPIEAQDRERLRGLRPADYIGLAAALARLA
jgi:adenylosuccinate lyase